MVINLHSWSAPNFLSYCLECLVLLLALEVPCHAVHLAPDPREEHAGQLLLSLLLGWHAEVGTSQSMDSLAMISSKGPSYMFDGLVWLSCTPSEASFQVWVQLICAGFHRDRNVEPHAHWCCVSSLEDSPRHFSRHVHNIRSLFTWNVTKNGNIHVLINEFMDEDKFLAVMDDFEITLSTALNQGWPS